MQRNWTIWAIAATVAAGITWAAIATTETVTLASGTVAPKGGIVSAMHEDGGTISKIFAGSGDRVKVGDPIVSLEPFEQQVDERTLNARVQLRRADIVRLEAERDGVEPVWPDDLSQTVISDTKALYKARSARRIASLERLNSVLKSQKTELEAVKGLVDSRQAVVSNQATKVDNYRTLVEKGTVSKMRFADEESKLADSKSDLALALSSLSKTGERIASTMGQIDVLEQTFAEETFRQLQSARDNLKTAEGALNKIGRRGENLVIRATVDGVIKTVNRKVGEVINFNTVIAEIVPNTELIVNAKLPIAEIGYVYQGQKAKIMISSSDGPRFGTIGATVTKISPDAIQDENGLTYYKLTLILDSDHFVHKSNSGITYPLVAGIQVRAMMITGKKTIMEYILSPLISAVAYAAVER